MFAVLIYNNYHCMLNKTYFIYQHRTLSVFFQECTYQIHVTTFFLCC